MILKGIYNELLKSLQQYYLFQVIHPKDISQVKPYNWRYQLILTSLAFSRLLELSKTYLKVIVGTNNAYLIK